MAIIAILLENFPQKFSPCTFSNQHIKFSLLLIGKEGLKKFSQKEL